MKDADSIRKISDKSGIKVNTTLLSKLILKGAEKEIDEAAKKGEYEVYLNFRGILLGASVPKKERMKKSYVPPIDQYESLIKNEDKFHEFVSDLIKDFNKYGYWCRCYSYDETSYSWCLGSPNNTLFSIEGRSGFAGLRVHWKCRFVVLSNEDDDEVQVHLKGPEALLNLLFKS